MCLCSVFHYFFHTPEGTTLLAVIVALALGIFSPILGKIVEIFFSKTNLVFKDKIIINQVGPIFGRLVIINESKATARSVEAYLEMLEVEISPGLFKQIENFIPLPLGWTHGHLDPRNGPSIKDIKPNQSVMLDLFSTEKGPCIVLTFVLLRYELKESCKSKLIIILYQENGQIVKKEIIVFKKGNDWNIEIN